MFAALVRASIWSRHVIIRYNLICLFAYSVEHRNSFFCYFFCYFRSNNFGCRTFSASLAHKFINAIRKGRIEKKRVYVTETCTTPFQHPPFPLGKNELQSSLAVSQPPYAYRHRIVTYTVTYVFNWLYLRIQLLCFMEKIKSYCFGMEGKQMLS